MIHDDNELTSKEYCSEDFEKFDHCKALAFSGTVFFLGHIEYLRCLYDWCRKTIFQL